MLSFWIMFRSQDCLLVAPSKPSTYPYSLCCLTAFLDLLPASQQGNRPPQSKASLSMSRGRCFDRWHIFHLHQRSDCCRITTGCLWHACRAITIGVFLVVTGIILTIIGMIVNMMMIILTIDGMIVITMIMILISF